LRPSAKVTLSHVVAAPWRREVLELAAEIGLSPARGIAEHVLEDVVDPAEAAAPSA